jgi:spore coat polysaccharide biosynthesis predicted glycosyltransferase SpsG
VAAEFAKLGFGILLLTRELDAEVSKMIAAAGHRSVQFRADVPEQEDLALTLRACTNDQCYLITDSHDLSERYYMDIHDAGVPIISFDDYAGVPYASDVVINHNIGAERFNYRVASHTRLLLGPRYLPLREPFRRLLRQAKPLRNRVSSLVVTLGGMPETDAAFVILDGIRDWAAKERVHLTIVAGVRAERHVLEQFEKRLPPAGKVLVNPDLPRLLLEADLAIVNGSVTAYEATALGIPLIMTAVSPNQEDAVAGFRNAGAAVTLPNAWELTPPAVEEAVAALAGSLSWRAELSKHGRELVDGMGTDRIVQATLATTSERGKDAEDGRKLADFA